MPSTLSDDFHGPAGVTVVYMLLYYAFMILQLDTRSAALARLGRLVEGKPFSTDCATDNQARMGERTFLNTLEQMGAFLVALWTCAACVSCELATVLGAIAVFFRMLLPIFWSMGQQGSWNWRVELSTQPYYCCVLGMLGTVATWSFAGVNVADECAGWALALLVLAYYAVGFAIVFVWGKLLFALTNGAYADLQHRES